ncbi:MAG: hypothetical protein ABI183_20005 [Polyangiaceae bacterium]
MMRATSALFVIASATFAIACSDGRSEQPYGYGSPDPLPSTSTPSSATPILVDVDTGKTMNAAPGDGVGIFVEYAAGGQWHVWWTCDTNKTSESCAFNIKIAAKTGLMSNLALSGAVQGDSLLQSDDHTLSAVTSTTSNAVDVKFTGDPGGTIEIEAAVGGIDDSSFFFFVQNGTVNGGYSGTLSDPLRFEGTAP